jgi:hypothetical protein
MFGLAKKAVKTQLRAVDGVPVDRDGLKISLVQFYCRERLFVDFGAKSAEDGFQVHTQGCWREALVGRQRRKGFVAVRVV